MKKKKNEKKKKRKHKKEKHGSPDFPCHLPFWSVAFGMNRIDRWRLRLKKTAGTWHVKPTVCWIPCDGNKNDWGPRLLETATPGHWVVILPCCIMLLNVTCGYIKLYHVYIQCLMFNTPSLSLCASRTNPSYPTSEWRPKTSTVSCKAWNGAACSTTASQSSAAHRGQPTGGKVL